MRVLITGHTGYLGTVMVPIVKSAGHEVVGLDTGYFADNVLTDASLTVSTICKDIRDVTVEDLIGFDALIHLAALSNDPLGDLDPDWTYDINHLASVRLAELAKEAGIQRFLYASSCSIYGASGDAVLNEEAQLRPLTPYAISKVRTEEDLSKLATSSFSPVFLRNATAYGFSPRLRADVVLNNLMCWAFTTGKIYVMSDGTPWRPIVHTQDIANAFVAALDVPREAIHNQAFNVGSNNENYQVRELANIVLETVPGCIVEYAENGGPDPRSYRVDFSKITQHMPDFKAQWDARRGAEQLYHVFQEVGLTKEDFQGRKFVRLVQLKHLLSTGQLDETLRWATT